MLLNTSVTKVSLKEVSMKPYYSSGNITIYLGDCREVLPTLSGIDAVVSDLPYGVDLGDVSNGQARSKHQRPYTRFKDTPEYLSTVCIPALKTALSIAKRGAVFCGNRNLWLYPPADDIGCWFVPAATSRSKWGFACCNPILYYGKSPRAGIGDTPNSVSMTVRSDDVDHPCPKPVEIMTWLVDKASLPGERILDPFMGSGTTLIAAKLLGRSAVGCEIEERYCEIAAKRLQQEVLITEVAQ
jgi:site-specific DNA-methyltransferase (adenine-specific)